MKILVVEDDPITSDSLAEVFKCEGFEPIVARCGRDGLTAWEQHRPHLICLDIMMPGMDGFEVCRSIRLRDTTTPILFLSAKNQEVDVVVGLGLGADDFIRKPFTRGEVIARIRAALRRSHGGNKDRRVLKMHDLTIWPDELRAERGGCEIELTAREASMLALLHEQAGRPVSRDLFLDRCWGVDYFPDSRTLDQHIAVLRKKVDRQDAVEVIETVRGVGYRFSPE